ncbi:hypothetical protein ACEWY4_022332 [Coilia grayii]|uniref:G-protein coupled receptors family 1 profile domain-containing protein n=2 Tax=Coilia TaxID=286536 RepID=A0ABD1J607_9TELE
MNISLSANVEFCYEALNVSCTRLTYPLSLRLPFYFFFVSTIIAIAGGNLLVMCTIVHFEQLQTPTNILIVSMSVADFLLGVIVMPPAMIEFLEKCWYFGDVLCKFHTAVDITLCNASVLHLTCISIDRFCAVSQPLQYKKRMTICVAFIMISVSWVLSAMFGFIVIFPPANTTHQDTEITQENCIGGCSGLHEKEARNVSYFFIFYFIPLTVMLSLYLRIFAIAIRQAHTIHVNKESNRDGKHNMTLADYKATKTLGIVIGVFLCCWTPFFICNVIDPVLDHSIPELLYESLMWVAYINSLFNPIIYTFSYSWFRKKFATLFKRQF